MFKTRKLNAIIAIEIILSMTLYYFVLIGFTAISYAIDIVETNNHNIDFSAYFIDANGEKTSVSEKSINEREYLYVDVTVKNEGYFNGIINLNNNNFNIVQEIQSDNIEAISGNEVKLKQINSGSTQTIKLLIQASREDSINRMQFNANTEIVLSGDYINSKNIDSENKFQINGTTNVQMIWSSSEDISSELVAKVLTNSIYELKGESKRIAQLLIDSNVKNNEYPVSKTEIKLQVPQNIENVSVFARSNNATNENMVFSEKDYEYDKTNNIVTINLKNDNEQVISWKKDCKDSLVVTFILNSDEDIKNQNLLVNSKITTYDQKILENNSNIIINEEIDGIVTSELITKENSIYKGKIYTGEDRVYYIASQVYINYSELIDRVIIDNDASKYLQNEIEIDANNVYKSTYLTKDNFVKILGENGNIIIKNENGVIIGSINNNTQADEKGNLTVNYNTEVNHLIIETSKPINEGTLNLVHTKAIKNSNLTREVINNLTGIKESSILKYNDKNTTSSNDKIIELKNTSSKAKFEVEPNKLTAVQKNTDVKMTVVLENSNESRDLYQNPVVRIKLPSQVKNLSAKCKAMYKNGLNISNARIYKENENQFIEIELQGTQTVYNTGVVDGTTIIIYADIEIDENAVNSNEEIIMNYTNELATSLEDGGEEKVSIQVEEIPEEVKAELEKQRIKALEAQGQLNATLKGYVGGQELSEGDTVYTGEIIKYEITLENNTNSDIENLNVQAMVPEGTTLIERVKDEELEEKYTVKQTENNTINKTIERINHLENNKITLQYEVRVDENTEVTNILNRFRVNSDTINIEKELSNNIQKTDISLVTLMHIRHSEIVNNGDEYSYYINVKNISNNDLNNIPVNVITNSAYKLIKIVASEDYQLISDTNQFEIETLQAGQSKTYIVEVRVDKGNENNASIYTIANNKNRSNYCSERIQSISLLAHLDSDNKNQNVSNENDIIYKLDIENNGDVSQNNLNIKQRISNYYDVIGVKLNGENIEFTKDYKNQFEGGDNENYYYIEYDLLKELNPGERISINITTQAYDIEHNENININSYAIINGVNTETITHVLEKNTYDDSTEPEEENNEEISDDEYVEDPTANEKDEENITPNESGNSDGNDKPEDNTNPDDKTNPGENVNPNGSTDGNNNVDNKKYSISGRVWLDENGNGQRDSNEKDINDVQITLLNVETNATQKVNNSESYKFTNLNKGKYIAIFEYDTNKYNLTQYQAENVSKDLNSDVEKNKITYEGKEQVLATTDILNITNEDITNIDLGLVIAKNFDLELTKTISKITISNTEGTTVKEYNNTELAKVEIGAKYLKNSTVIIEYSIKVKNTGEIAGYAQQIVDYKPTDLKFNSSLNSSWYQSGEYLYSNALEKTKIEPGETKELKLVLTKEMTESNTGLTNNMAEINQSTSINNTNDSDSTSGNKTSKEDDLGQANVIIGVKTGAAINYILISILIILATAFGGYIINKIALKIDD